MVLLSWILGSSSLFYLNEDGFQTWQSTPGFGKIRKWQVSDTSDKVRITNVSGKVTSYSLRQYRFKNGDFFLVSLLVLSENKLLVTHEQGGYIVNTKGQVLHEISRKKPIQFVIANGHVRQVASIAGPFEEGPGNRLDARAFNGKTILATYSDADLPYVVLLDTKLRRTHAWLFSGTMIKRVLSEGNIGWRLFFKGGGGVRISNSGDLTALEFK